MKLTEEEQERIDDITNRYDYDTPLSRDDASFVWQTYHRIQGGDSHLRRLFLFVGLLGSECAKGKRCGVCARYDDPSCATEC